MDNSKKNQQNNEERRMQDVLYESQICVIYARLCKFIVDKKNHAYLLAIMILCEIIYWFRPKKGSDEPKYKGDMLQKQYSYFANLFNASRDMVVKAFNYLEDEDYIHTEFRIIEVDETRLNNRMFIELNIDKVISVLEADEEKDRVSNSCSRGLQTKVGKSTGKSEHSNNSKLNNLINQSSTNTSTKRVINPSIKHEQGRSKQGNDGLTDGYNQMISKIRLDVSYDDLIIKRPDEVVTIDALINAMCELYLSKRDFRLGNRYLKYVEIVDILHRINYDLMMYMLDSVKANSRPVTNMNSYLKTVILNAPEQYAIKKSVATAKPDTAKAGFNNFQQTNLDDALDEMEKLFLREINSKNDTNS